MQRVNLELLVADYDRIGSSEPIGKVILGYNRKSLEIKHWKEMIDNPRRPVVHWHVLKVKKIIQINKLSIKENKVMWENFEIKGRKTSFSFKN